MSTGTPIGRRSLLVGAATGVTALSLPRAAAHASTGQAGPTPEALEDATTFSFASPGFVDLVAGMSAASGTETLHVNHYWHLGYAYRELSIDAVRLIGTVAGGTGTNTTAARISIAPADDVRGDFPGATTLSSSAQPYEAGQYTEISFTATTIPARRYFLIAVAGGNAGRARVDDAPSRIGLVGGQPTIGFSTGYWESGFSFSDATTLNGFTDGNRSRATSVDRVGWRVTVT